MFSACSSPENRAPVASFGATPTSGQAPLEVSFDASASSDPDGTLSSFAWDFGDGSSASGAQVRHIYGVGSFTVTLTVADDQGATASAETVIKVTDGMPLDDRGDISGTITLSNTLAEGQAAQIVPGESLELLARAAELPAVPSGGEFVPGEVIVQFKAGLSTQAVKTLSMAGRNLERVRPLPVANTYLYRLIPGSAGSAGTAQTTGLQAKALRTATLQMSAELAERSNVRAVTPNRIYHALRTPDDAFYVRQWHYPAVNLPQAWDLTTGSADIVVAVVDTGISVTRRMPALPIQISSAAFYRATTISPTLTPPGTTTAKMLTPTAGALFNRTAPTVVM